MLKWLLRKDSAGQLYLLYSLILQSEMIIQTVQKLKLLNN
ncbi:hypothetical protein FEM08_32950 [Flavobacterium gilvum]|nr:hypothetical protein FEM08_32950 [Flavobacterium gilvum]